MTARNEELVRRIQQRVDSRLEQAAVADRAAHHALTPAEEVGRLNQYLREELDLLAQHRVASGLPPLDRAEEGALAQAVLAALNGLGPLDRLLRRDDVENIFLIGCDTVFLELADGSVEAWPDRVAESDGELVQLLSAMFARLGGTEREFSAGAPIGNLRLPAGGPLGARLAAVMEVTPRPHVAIRRHRLVEATLDDLVANGTLDKPLRELLIAAVRAGLRIIVSGQWGAGKTTLLRALCHEIDRWEHVVTIEDDYELGLQTFPDRHPLVTAMQARLPNAEGVGEITLDDLIKQAQRHSPQRIILGEVRGGEVTALLRALGSGTGGMCTLHADDGWSVFDRIAALAQLADPPLPVSAAYRWTASAVDLVVHVRRSDAVGSRKRFVSQVLEVGPAGDTERPDATEVFSPRLADGRAVAAFPPSARLLDVLEQHGMDRAIFDGAFQ